MLRIAPVGEDDGDALTLHLDGLHDRAGPCRRVLVRQNPWSAFDPEGLATSDDYKQDQKKATDWYTEATKDAGGDAAKQKPIDETYNKWMDADQKGISKIEMTARYLRNAADALGRIEFDGGATKRKRYEEAANLDDSTELFHANAAAAELAGFQSELRPLVLGGAAVKAVGSVLSAAGKAVQTMTVAAKGTLQVAQEGGRHAGLLKNYVGKSPAELQKGIASLQKQIAEHQGKIANPEKFIPNFKQLDLRQQKALLESKWPGDIQRQQEQADILRGLLGN